MKTSFQNLKDDQFKTLSIEKQKRPLLFGRFDEMVQRFIIVALNRSAVFTRFVAISTAKVLLIRYSKLTGPISLNKRSWSQSLFKRMNCKRRRFKFKLEIPEGAKKKAELLLLHSTNQKTNENLSWSF